MGYSRDDECHGAGPRGPEYTNLDGILLLRRVGWLTASFDV